MVSRLSHIVVVLATFHTSPLYAGTMLQITDINMRPADWNVLNKHSPVSIFDSSFVNTEALHGTASAKFWSAIFRRAPVWDPIVDHPIKTVSLSADFFLPGPRPRSVRFAPVLVQGQDVYAPPGDFPYFDDPNSFETPQGLSWDMLPISLFNRHEIGTGPAVLDFTPGAPPIQFGIAARYDLGNASFRFGNVNFRVTGVPEPAAGVMFVTALFFGLVFGPQYTASRSLTLVGLGKHR